MRRLLGLGSSSAVWPVRAMKTSSRLGWPSEKSVDRDAGARSSSASASARALGIVDAGRGQRDRIGVERATSTPSAARSSVLGLLALRRVRAAARAARRRRPTPSARRCVPSAITRPWSITAIRSASWSASSRYCVVSSTVVPVAHERPDDVPDLVAAARVQPGGRLVEEQQVGRDDDAGGDVQPPPHAAGVRLDQPAGRLGQVERAEQLVGPRRARRAVVAEQPAEQDEVLERRSAPRRPRRTGR